MTLARRHFQRVTAAQASASTAVGETVNANAYELQLAKLAEDKRRLKEVQSIERRIEVKRQLLPEYEPWVEGALESGRGGQDAVLMTVMVWRIDVGDYYGALRIAGYALQHGLVMPDQYKRDVPTLLAEEIADQALAAMGSGQTFDSGVLAYTQGLTDGRDMPDEVRAKLHKALGLALAAQAGEPPFAGKAFAYAEGARDNLRRALQLHERVGVKKDLERIERGLKNSEPGGGTPASTTTTDAESKAAESGAPGSPDADTGAPAPESSSG